MFQRKDILALKYGCEHRPQSLRQQDDDEAGDAERGQSQVSDLKRASAANMLGPPAALLRSSRQKARSGKGVKLQMKLFVRSDVAQQPAHHADGRE